METDKYSDYVGIFTFLSGALMILTFLMFCFLVWRAVLWLRARRNLDDGAVEDIEESRTPGTRRFQDRRQIIIGVLPWAALVASWVAWGA